MKKLLGLFIIIGTMFMVSCEKEAVEPTPTTPAVSQPPNGGGSTTTSNGFDRFFVGIQSNYPSPHTVIPIVTVNGVQLVYKSYLPLNNPYISYLFEYKSPASSNLNIDVNDSIDFTITFNGVESGEYLYDLEFYVDTNYNHYNDIIWYAGNNGSSAEYTFTDTTHTFEYSKVVKCTNC